ncbi:MAG: amidohydrolase family protein [Terriglobia bacterium]
MKKTSALLLLFVLPDLLLVQSEKNPPQKSLVFTHLTVIDATGAPAQPDTTVVITGDRISALSKTGKVTVPKDAQVVDATGKFLIPGLWDMHVHTLWQETLTETFFPLFIANGVTGVRDMGGHLELFLQWRKEIAEGKLLGPRLVAAGPIVDGPEPVHPEVSIAVANEAEGRDAVNSLKKRGADFIKVYNLPREAYFAIADEAKKQGIPFAGHVPLAVTAAEASNAGQRSFEHLTPFVGTDQPDLACASLEATSRQERGPTSTIPAASGDAQSEEKCKALFARFVRNATWQVPTLVVRRARAFLDRRSIASDARLRYIPASMTQEWEMRRTDRLQRPAKYFSKIKREYQKELILVSVMHRARVRFLTGSDVGNPYLYPGFSLHDELALLVEAGFTPMKVLQAATRNAAEYLGLLESLGTVEERKIADLVLLEANPLEEISNTQRIAAVVVRGKLIPKSSLEAILADVEAAANQM